MFLAILILLAMPFTDLSKLRGIQFRPISKIAFFVFLGNFLILMQLGAKHVESPYIELGQLSTVVYFSYFLIVVPVLSLFENSILELACSGINEKNEKDDISYIMENNVHKNYSMLIGDYSGKIFSFSTIFFLFKEIFI
jgi:ubiquinol-cytochrome c reductase cytochrome b subunit